MVHVVVDVAQSTGRVIRASASTSSLRRVARAHHHHQQQSRKKALDARRRDGQAVKRAGAVERSANGARGGARGTKHGSHHQSVSQHQLAPSCGTGRVARPRAAQREHSVALASVRVFAFEHVLSP